MRDRNPAKKNKKLEKFNKILPTRSFGLSASQSESRSLGHSGQSVSQSDTADTAVTQSQKHRSSATGKD